MKQHISAKQLKELSTKGKAELFKWRVKKGYARNPFKVTLPPLLSIGQMIEFLGKSIFSIEPHSGTWSLMIGQPTGSLLRTERHKELADALWEAVKEILNER